MRSLQSIRCGPVRLCAVLSRRKGKKIQLNITQLLAAVHFAAELTQEDPFTLMTSFSLSHTQTSDYYT